MQSHISSFQQIFAPSIEDDESIIKEILDVFSLIVGVGSAFVWNVGMLNEMLLEWERCAKFSAQ